MKVLSVLVCMFVLNSCTWSDVPAQECYPPDTTGVENSVVVLDGVTDDVSEIITNGTLDINYLEEWAGGEIITHSVRDEWKTLYAIEGDATVTETTISSSDSFIVTLETVGDITALDSDISTKSELVYPPYSAAIEEFLELYKEYETECRNDSTAGIIYDNLDVTIGWIHKEPTFTGFIEQLRKK